MTPAVIRSESQQRATPGKSWDKKNEAVGDAGSATFRVTTKGIIKEELKNKPKGIMGQRFPCPASLML